MNKQRICATVLSTAVLGAMIGCGQKNEIDQSVPDTVIEIAKTTSSTSATSSTPYQTTSSTFGSSGSNTSSTSASSSVSTTTVVTTIHYAGNPNLTVRKTAEVIPETQTATQAPITTVTTALETEVSVTEAPVEAPSETATTIGSLVTPNSMFTEEDMRFTFDGVSIKPGEDSMAFRTAMQDKGFISTEWVDGFPFISYDELGIKLELIGDGLGTKAVTISGTSVATEKGIHVGSTPDEVRAAYGSIYEPVSSGAIYRYLFDSNGDGENDYQMDITFDGNSLVSEITYCCLTIG